ncbi:Nitrite-sensitive transcriptional repressor NsrR [Leptospirillum ferriphilum]|jgi:Rrf2 family nitric oxide-sensitive transcriptional repressor|uniref:Nitrite-sensitive transcriptional repressor NsrR n=3 Tax=Leptospirillum TaxID=179 RepID=A0A094W9L5_9BACT|nr:Rrf2 family transcriptional regulator [Leptospirillum ferriphilum]KGA93200.1 Nitrite-sensitive transcriptional repressor NsrR [Leptospirillum ferriphilum]
MGNSILRLIEFPHGKKHDGGISMQLTLYSDYSIRVLLYLSAKTDGPATISEVAESYGISRNHLVKVVHNLSQSGYIRTTRGKKGGMVLGRDPKEISIGGLLRQTEPDFRLVECLQEESSGCPIDQVCSLKAVFRTALYAFLKTLDGYTLADITGNVGLLKPILIDRVRSGKGESLSPEEDRSPSAAFPVGR